MRVLAWNIQWFTLSRIAPEIQPWHQGHADDADRAFANLRYIKSTVRQADPDVFVLVEARCTWGPLAELAPGDGPTALGLLLLHLRELSGQWCLVPPVRINPSELEPGYTETMGVFWRNDRLRFLGPLVWPPNQAGNAPSPTGPAVSPTQPSAQSYPAPWDWAMPHGANVPLADKVAAACVRFYTPEGQEVFFNQSAFRRPVLTIFRERAGAQRLIRLITFHLPPNSNAQQALANLTDADPIFWQPAANEMTVLVGDFNLDLNGSVNASAAWDVLTHEHFRLIRPPLIPAPFPVLSRRSPTTYVSTSTATTDNYRRTACYDYGAVKYGSAPQAIVPAVVAERVAGVPAAPPMPGFTYEMAYSLNTIRQIADEDERTEFFRRRWNYGHIARPSGTSDHLPVFMVVT
jgi:hypothetical protein